MPEVQAQFPQAIAEAQSRYWPYPLVIVNDKLAIAGDVNAYRIARMVRQELEIE